jgi:hypothetical protein
MIFIPPIVPYLLRSAVSYLAKSRNSSLVQKNVYLSDEILTELKWSTQDMWGCPFEWQCPANIRVTCLSWDL